MPRRKPRRRTSVTCSFCNKSDSEVQTLFAGPTSNICDECVEILMPDRGSPMPQWVVRPYQDVSGLRFGESRATVEALWGPPLAVDRIRGAVSLCYPTCHKDVSTGC